MSHQAVATPNANSVLQRGTRRCEQSRIELIRDVLSLTANKTMSLILNPGISSTIMLFLAMPFLLWLLIHPIGFSGLSACHISKNAVTNGRLAESTITLPSGVICAFPVRQITASARDLKVIVGPTNGTLLSSQAGLVYRSRQNFKGNDSFILAWPGDTTGDDLGLVKINIKVK